MRVPRYNYGREEDILSPGELLFTPEPYLDNCYVGVSLFCSSTMENRATVIISISFVPVLIGNDDT